MAYVQSRNRKLRASGRVMLIIDRTVTTSEKDVRPIPLILLTGFLGAGKTTVLNRVLAAQHHRRVAVLVNELGRIDVDAGLIRARAGDVIELCGGCICHQIGVARELWSALDDLVQRSRPDVVILETTGIAEPEPILDGLPPTIRAAAVVTVVDAEAGVRQLGRHEEARAQVSVADRILISKVDLVAAPVLAALHAELQRLNPRAERAAFPPGDGGTAALVPWLLQTRTATAAAHREPARSPEGAHRHQLAAATYVDDAPLVAEAVLAACQSLGDRLVRAKGFIHVAGEPRRGFLERAGERTRLEYGAPWGDDPRVTQLVLIGEGLDEAALQRQLWACRAGG